MRKILSTVLAVSVLASLTVTPVMALDPGALPNLNNKSDNLDVTQQGFDMNVKVNGGQGAVGLAEWNSFNVGSNAKVNFEFTNHNQTSLNKVLESGGMSEIYGQLTNSCGANCGYAGTGKVILINPNGILFGETANVNLNSFTATTFDGDYKNNDKYEGTLSLTRGKNAGDITVKNGAVLNGDRTITLAGSNVTTYAGSKIKTGGDHNSVRIVTGDGVNFVYSSGGSINDLTGLKASTDKMRIILNGDIESGFIDARNGSVYKVTRPDGSVDISDINVGGTLKANKAEVANDGNIWLTSYGKAITGNNSLTADGNIKILAKDNVSTLNSELTAGGKIDIQSQEGDISINNSKLSSGTFTKLNAGNIASLQNNSSITAKDYATIEGGTSANVVDASTVTADGDVNIKGGIAWLKDAQITSKKNINIEATKTDVLAEGASKLNTENGTIDVKAARDVKTLNDAVIDLTNSGTKIQAGNDINVKLKNVENRQKGLIAEAEKNVTIETDGTLSVSRLVAKNGDMTLTADKVIAGYPKVTDDHLRTDGDSADRAYIYVLNGKFTSKTAHDNYVVTDSADPVDKSEGNFNKRHHIEYGNGQEKILLVNKREYTESQPTPPGPSNVIQTPDDTQAKMLNKLPRQPEIFNNNTIVNDGRTSFVDVFAAASQIEIEEDEE